MHISLSNSLPNSKVGCPAFHRQRRNISFSKKIKVDEYKSRRTGETVSLHCVLKFDLLTLLSFFKHLLPIVFQIFNHQTVNTKAIITDNVSLLTQKGFYPYDYVSSIERFSETQLPPKSEFYSKLNDEDISEEDYQHALKVWNTFNCQNIRDYHDLYLKSDVLLLADVFENFRKTCLKHYKLDLHITIHLQALLGMRVSRKQDKNYNYSMIMIC